MPSSSTGWTSCSASALVLPCVALAIVALWVKPASQSAATARPVRSERTVDLDLAALEEALAMEEAGESALLAGASPGSTGPVSQIEM